MCDTRGLCVGRTPDREASARNATTFQSLGNTSFCLDRTRDMKMRFQVVYDELENVGLNSTKALHLTRACHVRLGVACDTTASCSSGPQNKEGLSLSFTV